MTIMMTIKKHGNPAPLLVKVQMMTMDDDVLQRYSKILQEDL